MTFTRVPFTTKEQWLRDRKNYVTATDAAAIRSGSDTAFQSLWEKKNGVDKFTGNRYTEWGNQREPLIAESVAQVFPDLEPNEALLVSDEHPQFAATPDMISPGGDLIGELKTKKGGFPGVESVDDPAPIWRVSPGYEAQVQWQLLVTGADRCVFAWESYEEDAEGSFYPTGVSYVLVTADKRFQNKLVDAAFKYLDYEPDALEQVDADFTILGLIEEIKEREERIADLKSEVKAYEAERDLAKARLLEELGERPGTYGVGSSVVTVKPGRVSKRFDRKAFAKAYPDLESQFVVESAGQPTVIVKGAVSGDP